MNKIKAVFFDLDDTLYDCSGSLVKASKIRAAKAMVKAGLPATIPQTIELLNEIEQRLGPRIPAYETLTSLFNLSKKDSERIQAAGQKAYNAPGIGKISLFPGVTKLLQKLRKQKIVSVIVTTGNRIRQKQKIQKLKLQKRVDHIEYHETDKEPSKQKQFEKTLQKYGLQASEVAVVGDRIQSEIRVGNSLGMITIRLRHGRYSVLKPLTKLELPDFEIETISRLLPLLEHIERSHLHNHSLNPSIVLIGGGSGMANLLYGLKNYTKNLTAIITTTDSGRSSGRLRKDFDIVAPGDIRNCLVALSSREETLKTLFQYRFDRGELKGHSFGNLFLATLYKITGNFEKAVSEAGRLLAITGRVLPATITNTHICARLANGKILFGEDAITSRNKQVHNRSPITDVFLKPKNAKALPEAVSAIAKADLIVIGPGQFYNSIVANLLVPPLRKALQKTSAKKIYICNIMTQQGQTDHYSASDHIRTLQNYIGENTIDTVLVNTQVPPQKHLIEYEKEHAYLVNVDRNAISRTGLKAVYGDFLQKDTKKKFAFNRREYLRHDSDKVSKALLELL